jgi:hypothetical protein
MTGWVLILFAHVGMQERMGGRYSNALSTVQFSSQQACVNAGKAAEKLGDGIEKKITYACVKQ